MVFALSAAVAAVLLLLSGRAEVDALCESVVDKRAVDVTRVIHKTAKLELRVLGVM